MNTFVFNVDSISQKLTDTLKAKARHETTWLVLANLNWNEDLYISGFVEAFSN